MFEIVNVWNQMIEKRIQEVFGGEQNEITETKVRILENVYVLVAKQ